MAEGKPEPQDGRINANAFELEVTTDLDEETPDKPKGLPLHTRILIGLGVGVVAGLICNAAFQGGARKMALINPFSGSQLLIADLNWIIANITEPLGALFLRLLLMIVVPLVFSSLVVGVAGIGDIRKLGRVGIKSFVYCLVLSAISVLIGLILANTIKPGTRIDPATKAALEQRYSSQATKEVESAKKGGSVKTPLMQVVETIVPSNPFAAISGVPANPSQA